MEPRESPRERDKRMDAAVDAITKKYGFSEELVGKVTNELLKEYGGQDGWFFIEQYSFQELREAILRYQEEHPEEKNSQENFGGGDSVDQRDKRMDAAVDVLTKSFGFSEELVKKVANELLKEYGGEDGWFFIQQYAFQELREAIFCYQEEHPEQTTRQESSGGGGDSVESNYLLGGTAKNHAPIDAAGPSSIVAGPVCSEVVDNGLEKDTKEDINHLPCIEWDGKGWKDTGLDQSSSQREISIDEDPDTSSLLSPVQLNPTTPLTSSVPSGPDTSLLLSPVQVIPPPATAAQPRRRFPCYGWIESDEEDFDDFMELEPAVEVTETATGESWEYLSCRMDTKAKRRSRWDMKPDDP